ncbi:MAG TPA: TetR/AcrR family transcriptional regulator [Spirochaetota bacterium]|nr:TetR/AcrR family transcriptional regulator [Spirochaetota bacterium]HOD16142.1 TetR/AcrR family transcriptional regulator [Spirochaetota bacterium]HPG50007.1 TetR/AcrR family transcriptional regulator [Spirochaetota bacterium]HPN10871.1 TetR/AcrR family transcriptional regulator [Spirochaetota bacterium]HQL80833.1 TetR/AcrR family transcriptional regulator [Spirochaetota bacterium]
MGTQQRKINEKIKRRKDILEVAKGVFISKGLEAATMEEIANKAELSKGTLYLYFKSKEELYVSLVEEGAQLFHEFFKRATNPVLSATKQTLNLIEAFYSFYTEHRLYYTILTSIQSGSIDREKISDAVYDRIHGMAMELLEYIVNIIRKGITDGEFIDVDPRETALSFWALATGVFAVSDFMQRNELGEVKDKKLLDFASDLMLARLQAV